ncbi:sugar transferase [Oryzifoliimicrobium ureilyticus]|uniref:sugar transferase n=1 Tax=Oryzifoliimicrobium ureilyticus TaxID=3113724 RepID=UPI003076327F
MKSAARSDGASFFGAVQDGVYPPTGGVLKRIFDVSAATIGLIFLSPIFLMVMLLVKLSSKGPAFYGHRRIGHNGEEFRCLKFRTMVVDGDRILREYLDANPKAMEEWKATRKLQNDPRVTTVGSVLRKLSLDELPQLINIIRGDMSVVGPRPVVRDELELYQQAAVYYLKSRPGLTGLWQISGRNDVSYQARVNFDMHYVENWSLLKDVAIIARTIPAVCMQRGSY